MDVMKYIYDLNLREDPFTMNAIDPSDPQGSCLDFDPTAQTHESTWKLNYCFMKTGVIFVPPQIVRDTDFRFLFVPHLKVFPFIPGLNGAFNEIRMAQLKYWARIKMSELMVEKDPFPLLFASLQPSTTSGLTIPKHLDPYANKVGVDIYPKGEVYYEELGTVLINEIAIRDMEWKLGNCWPAAHQKGKCRCFGWGLMASARHATLYEQDLL